MLDKVLATIKKYNMIEKGDKIVIGVSGGADSVCLTDILNKVKKEIEIEIILVHINHNIRGEEAKRDENFVIELGKKYNNLVKVFSYDVEKLAKENTNVQKFIEGKTIVKVIAIPGKLVNIVVK